MKSIVKLDAPLVSPPSNFKGDFFKGTNISAASHRFTHPIFLFFYYSYFSYVALNLCCVEIQSGLIGVGLINVEDRPGILTLDKGNLKDDKEHFLPWELVLFVG